MELETFLRIGRKIIPKKLFKTCQPVYHWLLAFVAGVICGFPSRKIFVLGVTGTKGKTSTLEIINAILEEAGYKTSLASSLRFKIGKKSEKNTYKMTTPGRFFMQRFLRQAVKEKCRYALLELTSEAAIQYRHKFIDFDALIFTNLAPEHIESHGSFENYRAAKLKFFEALEKSRKKKKTIIANRDDPSASHFLNFDVDEKRTYGQGEVGKNIFDLYNISAATAFVQSQKIGPDIIKSALEKFPGIEGRMEEINEGQNFKVIVDYAHTPDSLEKVYEVFKASRKICVLGSTGGGRDKWKRPKMGEIASQYCSQIILTNEDPYDENPEEIIKDITRGIKKNYERIMDRGEAIKKAIQCAQPKDVIIITGKGAEPWIMGPKGTKIAWDDRLIVREELRKIKIV